jgi:DNA-binding LacI/PurR family transcriptional regulator
MASRPTALESARPKEAIEAVMRRLILDRSEPLAPQISAWMRHQVLGGHLPAGSRIPSIQDLSRLWGVDTATVNRGLRALVAQNLLQRSRSIGTTVRAAGKQSNIGVYLANDQLFGERWASFYPMLYLRLHESLERRGYGCKLWVDTRSIDQHRVGPAEEMRRAIEDKEIMGLVSPIIRKAERTWLKALPIPVVGLTELDANLRPSITSDFFQMFREFFQRFARDGCQTVGALAPFPRLPPGKGYSTGIDFFRAFDTQAHLAGLETRPEWVIAKLAPPDHASYAYQEFGKFWDSLGSRPDAMVVYPSGLVHGAVLAILDRRIRVPKDLRLGFCGHQGIRIACPFSVIWAETNIESVAEALVNRMFAMMEGRASSKRAVLPFHFWEGPSYPAPESDAFKVVNPAGAPLPFV